MLGVSPAAVQALEVRGRKSLRKVAGETGDIYGRVVKGDFSINPEPPRALHLSACTPYTRAYYTHTWK